jgi:hypothetical protein
VPVKVIWTAVSSFVVAGLGVAEAVGALLALIVMLTVTTFESTVPSLTLNLKESEPVKFAAGV